MIKLRQPLAAFASVLALVALVTLLAPLPTRGQKPNDSAGPAKPVLVGNVVQTQPALPPGAFSVVLTGVGTFSGADPEGTSYAITSITVASLSTGPTIASFGAVWGTTSDCTSFGDITSYAPGPKVAVRAGETVHLTFPQPFVFSARPGAAACLRNSLGGGQAEITVVGYRF